MTTTPTDTHDRAVRSAQRRDIQGLRALAVLAVVGNHLWADRLPGGFVGVDIFFVISGFLITGLLLREYERSATISFRVFYTRRAKRLVPAATLVILTTAVVGYLLFPASKARGVVWDGLWSFLFVQNWHLASNSTDYFDENSGTSPLQHYWSLSVEEQFYLVWPWLLLLLLLLFARRGGLTSRGARSVAGGAIGVIIVLSFGWALIQAITAPSVAYFSTLTRGWELGLGALLAVLTPVFQRLPGWSRVVLVYGGIIAMLASLFLLDSATPWPAPGALLPTLGAAAVIVSGIGREARADPLLRNPVAVYIGNISYSLYLWHFPVIMVGTFLYPDAGRRGDLVFLAVAFALSVCAYHLVEEPLHKSPLLAPGATRPAWGIWLRSRRRGLITAGAASVATVAAIVAGLVLVPVKNPLDQISPEALASPDANQAVVEALAVEEWPSDLTPRVGSPRSEKYVKAWSVDHCLGEGMDPADAFDDLAERCVYGDPAGDKTLVILGDSVAITWATALDDLLAEEGWRIVDLTAEMCPASDVSVVRDTGTRYPGCDDFRERAFEYVAATAPDLVVLSETSTTVSRLDDGAEGDDAIAEVSDGMTHTIETVASAGATVVITSVPRTRSMGDCFDEYDGPLACTFVAGGQSHLAAM